MQTAEANRLSSRHLVCGSSADPASVSEEKKRKREREHCDTEGEADDFDPGKKVEVEPPPDRPIRACRTQPGKGRLLETLLVFTAACCKLGVGTVSFCFGEKHGREEDWYFWGLVPGILWI
ncbi:hypothetical protein P7K49_004339 [Saguinus oedipus]|uniref:Uncharacterized protein n=1 Tax=Saguinus oedipus TaxID=9490 RepID=A0ABQ9W740_SAGOE|nr:hypothetical protein P7K49_004339 [Saguinus oedipus]